MSWDFFDRDLEREANRLVRLVSGQAWVIALVILILVGGGYFVERYHEERDDAAMDAARIQGELTQVSGYLPAGAKLGRRELNEALHLTLSGDRPDDRAGDDHYAIYDASGRLLAEIGERHKGPVMTHRVPVDLGDNSRGQIVVQHASSHLYVESAAIMLVALALALAALIGLRTLPVRALLTTMKRLDESQHLRVQAEKDLRIHVGELEAAQKALQASSAQMELALEAAAESNQAKSQFLASMSHELRTPLNAIIGFSEMIHTETFGAVENEQYREYVELILGSGRHLLSLVNEILDLSKATAGKLELFEGEVDPAHLLRDIMRTMQASADEAGVTQDLTVPEGLPNIRVDPQRLTQVLFNLVSNAIKFNKPGGFVHVSVDYRPHEGMKIIVADTGIGIASEDIPKALERFGQVEDSFTRKFQGSGLGLPISKKLIELHGGTLTLQSVVGEGTRVTLWLPPERVLDETTSFTHVI
jgi:signal transduction histidine kinase